MGDEDKARIAQLELEKTQIELDKTILEEKNKELEAQLERNSHSALAERCVRLRGDLDEALEKVHDLNNRLTIVTLEKDELKHLLATEPKRVGAFDPVTGETDLSVAARAKTDG